MYWYNAMRWPRTKRNLRYNKVESDSAVHGKAINTRSASRTRDKRKISMFWVCLGHGGRNGQYPALFSVLAKCSKKTLVIQTPQSLALLEQLFVSWEFDLVRKVLPLDQ